MIERIRDWLLEEPGLHEARLWPGLAALFSLLLAAAHEAELVEGLTTPLWENLLRIQGLVALPVLYLVTLGHSQLGRTRAIRATGEVLRIFLVVMSIYLVYFLYLRLAQASSGAGGVSEFSYVPGATTALLLYSARLRHFRLQEETLWRTVRGYFLVGIPFDLTFLAGLLVLFARF